MSDYLRRNLLGCIAIFIALSGTAAALPGKNKVDSGDIKNANVKLADLARGSVDGSKVVDDSLKGSDVDESSLQIPQQALPTTLPPSGAAGGDLAGEFPNPLVREAALDSGGDLSGSLSAAQVNESGVTAGGDLNGSLANAQLDAGSVGDAEIQNGTRSVVIPASEVGFASLIPVDAPDTGLVNGFPALLFDPNVTETLNLAVPVPDGITANAEVTLRVLFSSASGAGNWRFTTQVTRARPNTGQTLASPTLIGTVDQSSPVPPANQLGLETGLNGTQPGLQGGDLLRLEFNRLGANAADTAAQDVAVHMFEFVFATER